MAKKWEGPYRIIARQKENPLVVRIRSLYNRVDVQIVNIVQLKHAKLEPQDLVPDNIVEEEENTTKP